ncbi:YeeE/YedE family protein [Cycloclasticus sp. 46_83_sub15_T18]|nr:YeeE/YedE family protein [Cycloclasticus sp. 46_83_sub15_T18]
MENFTPYSSLAGGILIGISASVLMLLNGRIAGISGIIAGIFNVSALSEKAWRFAFVIGLIAGASVYAYYFPIEIAVREHVSTGLLVIGGLLVGVGTAMGGGCTSGHGICGISRFSLRSITATMTFLLAGITTVYLVNYFIGA